VVVAKGNRVRRLAIGDRVWAYEADAHRRLKQGHVIGRVVLAVRRRER
jgi:NADPH:quinone reductase-like Zn-dependent oxidoreductase